MELAFVPQEKSGWRGRGAPARDVPDKILRMLKHTAETGEVGVIDISGESPEAITDVVSALRAGGRRLGSHTNIQRDKTAQVIRFKLAPRSDDT